MLHHPVESDVLQFLSSLVDALQPFAGAHSIALTFECKEVGLRAGYQPETVAADLIQLICRVVTFTPQQYSVKLAATLVDERDRYFLKLMVENTGANLSRIGEIAARTRNPVAVHGGGEKSTAFEIQWHLDRPLGPAAAEQPDILHPPDYVRSFYAAVRDRMRLHFQKQESPIAALARQRPKEAVFLQKVTTLIQVSMADETFNVEQLARSMAMSRVQLHRRLKPLTGTSPVHYIRDLRLAKAKELIEKEDFSLGEICFKVGFQSQSHFTRAFVEKFGVRPMAYRRGK